MIVLVVLLAAIAAVLLVYLWGRLETAYGWKGPACGCALMLVLAMAALEIKFPTWGFSPLNLVDPSDGDNDPRLESALTRALLDAPSGSSDSSLAGSPGDVAEVRVRDVAEFEERLRRVPDWDLIVLIGPMETGKEAAQDPRITSWWLRRRIAAAWNPRSDVFHSLLLVVRDDAVVGALIIRLITWPTSDWKNVIARTP